jgi:hypothetical protein
MTAAELFRLAQQLVNRVRQDEGPNGGLLSPETIKTAEMLEKAVRSQPRAELVHG